MAQDRKRIIDMPELNAHATEAGRQAKLEIRATGGNGRVYCVATVMYQGESSGGFTTCSFAMFQDFSQRLDQKKARATQKTIDTMFAECTSDEAIALTMDKARAHYAAKTATA